MDTELKGKIQSLDVRFGENIQIKPQAQLLNPSITVNAEM